MSGARRALLAGLIDHAALFPPASLTVGDALEEDRRARSDSHAWMIARFVCPASKLDSLRDGAGGWPGAPPLSVVLDGAPGAAPEAWPAVVQADAALVAGAIAQGAPVEALELRLPEARPEPAALLRVRESLAPLGLECYLELRRGGRWRDTLPAAVGAVAGIGARVKLRCGGERPEDFPSPEQVALVIAACREAGCVFKATAGLHHPVRSGATHGFLNLLAAAVFTDARQSELERILSVEDPTAFDVGEERLALGALEASADRIASARKELFAGYGSCSWREPIHDLHELGVLP